MTTLIIRSIYIKGVDYDLLFHLLICITESVYIIY